MNGKRWLCAALAAALLTAPAGAYQVPGANGIGGGNLVSGGINCIPEEQADMLHKLGLFNGRGNGDYAVNEPLTRAEAAALLTRFLGAERQAQAGQHTHPFTDVPDWASPYVGWLYENGLTNGMSATRYGAQNRTTGYQFSLFLSRALSGDDSRAEELLAPEEREWMDDGWHDETIFGRAASLLLCCRALLAERADGRTLAQYLQEQGVFETDFCDAAWDVLPPKYTVEDGEIVCRVAGIEAVSRPADGMTLEQASLTEPIGYVLAVKQEGDQVGLYALDPRTLEPVKMGAAAGTVGDKLYVAWLGEAPYATTQERRDFLRIPNGPLLVWNGQTLTEAVDAKTMKDAELTVLENHYALAVTTAQKTMVFMKLLEEPRIHDMRAKLLYVGGTENGPGYVLKTDDALLAFHAQDGSLLESMPVKGELQTFENLFYGEGGCYQAFPSSMWHDYKSLLVCHTTKPCYGARKMQVGAINSDPYVVTGKNGKVDRLLYVSGGEETEILNFHKAGLEFVSFETGWEGALCFSARNGIDPGVYVYWTSGDMLYPYDYTPDEGVADTDAMCRKETARLEKLGFSYPPTGENE